MQNAKLDVNGIFGVCCRHEFPVLFLDLKHGERYVDCLLHRFNAFSFVYKTFVLFKGQEY